MVLPSFWEDIFPLKNFENIKDYVEYYWLEKNIDDLDSPLYNSEKRKKWLELSPDINGFPKTVSYIRDENSVVLRDVSKELSNIQLFLPKGHALFHSGDLPKNIPLGIGATFKLKEVFSATLDPYIAKVHDSEDSVYWYITTESENIRCLPIPQIDGVGNEYEVIVLGSPNAKIIDVCTQKRNLKWLDGMEIDQEITIVYISLF